jgi:hypothetical protein
MDTAPRLGPLIAMDAFYGGIVGISVIPATAYVNSMLRFAANCPILYCGISRMGIAKCPLRILEGFCYGLCLLRRSQRDKPTSHSLARVEFKRPISEC